MKYPCELIKDILPIYSDGICSDATNKIIEEHLSKCTECSKLLSELKESDTILKEMDCLKEKSLEQEDLLIMQKIKSKLKKKQIITSIISVCIAFILIIGIVFTLSITKVPIEYNDGNISIVVQEDKLYYQLSSNHMYPIKDYRIVSLNDQSGDSALYFCLYTTLWNNLFGGEEKNFSSDNPFINNDVINLNNNISKIYYYSGDYSKFDTESNTMKNEISNKATLIWSKN